ncbi:hemerythrin domain-containing protein [Gordonia lacunae]|nr:hemerythrin domain-containing protein [Gordonia lacunae]
MPLLRDYTTEHERAVNLGGDAIRALDADDRDAARRLPARLAIELRSHWRGEEDGLFAQLLDTDRDLFAGCIDPLIAEHRDLDAVLTGMPRSARGSAPSRRVSPRPRRLGVRRVPTRRPEVGVWADQMTPTTEHRQFPPSAE